MASASVMAAVRARLVAGWAEYPVKYPNEDFTTPADGSPYLVVQYPLADEDQMSIGAPGANIFRETGVLRLVLMVPRGSGADEWAASMDALRALFRAKSFTGVSTYGASSSSFDDRSDDGNYWSLSSAIPYDADIFG